MQLAIQKTTSQTYFSGISLNILECFPGAANKSALVREHALSKISDFVSSGRKIQIVLPAFPAKSPNRKKTLGALPDLGEVLALQSLQKLCDRIEMIYAPGAQVIICSDGRVFSDLVGVSDTAVNAYALGIDKILKTFSLFHLTTFNLDEVFTEHNFMEMRRALVEDFATPLENIRKRSQENESDKILFNGIHRFLFEDYLNSDLGKSRSQTREFTKQLAYQVIQRSNAWSTLVEKQFPQALRLSIHPQHPETTKIPIRLLPTENQWRTPWHGVVLKEGKEFRLTTHAQARAQGAIFKEWQEQWGYFEKEMQ